jgi:hypothetical protein
MSRAQLLIQAALRAGALLAATAATLSLIGIAAAQPGAPCGKRAELLRLLEGGYTEKPIAMGLGNDGALIEVLTAADGATWTILISYPNGMRCMIASGQHWQSHPQIAASGRGA